MLRKGPRRDIGISGFYFIFFFITLINSLIKNFYNLNYYNAPIGDKLYKGFGRDSPINSTITYTSTNFRKLVDIIIFPT